MFRVMIVDDEPIIRAGLRHSVKWEELGFTVASEARNGIEALEKLEASPVDLIVTDIRMPRMDGVELLRSVKEKDSCRCVIFLSGFGEFKYAQEGLALGVFDYILKPMDPEKIVEVLKRAYKFIGSKKKEEEENRTLKEKLEFNRSISKEKILSDMLIGRELPQPSLADVISEYGIELDLGMSQAAVAEIDDFDVNAEEWVRSGKDVELLERIGRVFTEIINNSGKLKAIVLDGDIGCMNIILQPVAEVDLSVFESTSIDMVSSVLNSINMDLNTQVTIGIGRVYEGLNELHFSYRDARNALRHKYALGSNRIIHACQIDSSTSKVFSDTFEKEQLLFSYIILGDDRVFTVLEDIFNGIYSSGEGSVYLAGTAINRIAAGISRRIKEECGYLDLLYDTERLTAADFCGYEDISSIKQCFVYLVTSLLSVIREYKLNQRDNIISKACEFVFENIEEDISLRSVSEHLGISKNYFCSLFKQETGENFLEYVTRVKMERAKKLLRKGIYKAYEVSYMLGYQETGYFSRVFKKYTGYNPTEYRKSTNEDT